VRTYFEPARSYRSVWFLLVVLLALFAVDVALGTWLVHLPGWLVGAALVLGVGWLVVHAARTTHSLSLTEDELRIGDDALARADIVSVAPGVDSEVPVLGWSTGLRQGSTGLTLRLVDGNDVVVPSRFPDRLQAALGVGAAKARGEAEVRSAEKEDLARLAEIDSRAETVFRVAGYDLPEIAFDEDGLADAKAIFVVDRPPIAYAQLDEVDGLAHLAEIAVIPKSMRKGVGTKLLERACGWAREQGYPAITLVTYADVPWNAPWYSRHGFVEVEPTTPELLRRRRRQTELGLDAVGRRIVMRREFGESGI